MKARRADAAYRLRKYLRRHRLPAALCAGALALLIAFTVNQNVQLRRIQRERDRADRITKFMTGLFKISDPRQARGNSVSVREILDKGSQEIQTQLNHDPEMQAELMEVMGRVYQNLGLNSRARPLLETSVAIRRRFLGSDDPKTLISMDDLAWLLDQEGHPEEAIKLQEESLARRRRVQGPANADVRKSISNLSVFFFDAGRFAEAEQMQRQVLADTLRAKGPDHEETVTAESNLALNLLHDGRYGEAKTLLSQALRSGQRTLGPNHPLMLGIMNNLAVTLFRLGEYAEAERLQLETREIQRRVLGPENPDTAGSTYNLALFAERQGQREKALGLLREAIAHGLGPAELAGMATDEDLQSMRGDARFLALVRDAGKSPKH